MNRRTGASHAAMAAAIGKMTNSRVSDVIRGVRGIRGQGVIERVADGFGIPGEMLGLPRRPWEDPPGSVDATGNGNPHLASVLDSEPRARAQYAHDNPRSLDLLTVAGLRQRVQDLDARYVSEPSTALIAEAGQCLGQLGHWQTYTTTSVIRRDLHAAQAEASTLMGQLVWDASGRTEHATARTYFVQAETAARELCDPIAEGLALLRTAFVALYGEKNPRAGLELAQRTASTVKGYSQVLGGLAVLHAAEAHAMLHERKDCERELGKAERHFDQVSGSDAAAPLFSPSQFGRLAGSCFLFLGDAFRAEESLVGATHALRDGSKPHAIMLSNLALAYIRQRKIDEAIAALYVAIDVVGRHRGGGGLNLVFQAARELKPWRDAPAVHGLYDRLMNLMVVG
ncbi:transcriptional regulator [Streptomyces buecherae]|uniref:transcriptional regulator n=1 Tax=Streptomyces buecherae TaxID=2763006 RepID=UPI001E5BAB88|nr:transcriptional regulator [Streptomyces buecherae]